MYDFATRWLWNYTHGCPELALGGFAPKQRLSIAAYFLPARPVKSGGITSEVGRFTKGSAVPSTWGDAITLRINSQSNGFSLKYPYAADTVARVTGKPKS